MKLDEELLLKLKQGKPVLLTCHEASVFLKDYKIAPQTIKRWVMNELLEPYAFYSRSQPLFLPETIVEIKRKVEELGAEEYEEQRMKKVTTK